MFADGRKKPGRAFTHTAHRKGRAIGLRFRRRLRILPGVTINLNKNGTSVTVGRPGLHRTYGRRGTTTSIGIPGSGLAYSHTASRHRNRPPAPPASPVGTILTLLLLGALAVGVLGLLH